MCIVLTTVQRCWLSGFTLHRKRRNWIPSRSGIKLATYGPLIRECDPSLVQGTYLTNKQIILRKWEADHEFVEIITEIEKVHKILSPTHPPCQKKKKKKKKDSKSICNCYISRFLPTPSTYWWANLHIWIINSPTKAKLLFDTSFINLCLPQADIWISLLRFFADFSQKKKKKK